MKATVTSAMHVIKKEDKHSVLRAFIEQDLEERRRAPVNGAEVHCYYMIARSPSSPVAQAVAEIAEEAARLGIKIFTVFATANSRSNAIAAGSHKTSDTSRDRLIKDPRLLDAHEALLLSDGSAWVGDCMRRDPSQNDAYERYSSNCTFTGTSVRSAFDQLWAGARPLNTDWLSEAGQTSQTNASEVDMMASQTWSHQEGEFTNPAPSTRH